MARSASVIIAAHKADPADALAWFERSGLSLDDLDADGKLAVIHRRCELDHWAEALSDLTHLSDSDYETAPVLLTTSAMIHMAQIVNPDFRSGVIQNLPFELREFPLAADTSALEHHRSAQRFWHRAAGALGDLGLVRVANLAADHALWPAAGSVDTEIGCSQELEGGDATQEVFARVQD